VAVGRREGGFRSVGRAGRGRGGIGTLARCTGRACFAGRRCGGGGCAGAGFGLLGPPPGAGCGHHAQVRQGPLNLACRRYILAVVGHRRHRTGIVRGQHHGRDRRRRRRRNRCRVIHRQWCALLLLFRLFQLGSLVRGADATVRCYWRRRLHGPPGLGARRRDDHCSCCCRCYRCCCCCCWRRCDGAGCGRGRAGRLCGGVWADLASRHGRRCRQRGGVGCRRSGRGRGRTCTACHRRVHRQRRLAAADALQHQQPTQCAPTRYCCSGPAMPRPHGGPSSVDAKAQLHPHRHGTHRAASLLGVRRAGEAAACAGAM
jgi:hypothetical protein